MVARMKAKFISLGLFALAACAHRKVISENTPKTFNKVLVLDSWAKNVVDKNAKNQIRKGVEVRKTVLTEDDWRAAYSIAPDPEREELWVDFLSFPDGRDEIRVVLENGPLSKIKNNPSDKEEFAKKLSEYIEFGKSVGMHQARIRQVYLVRE